MAFQSEYFTFDGEESTDYGIYNVKLETGLADSPLFGNRQIVEEQALNRDNPYLHKVVKSPIEFNLTFSLLDEAFTTTNKQSIFHWLVHDDYRQFISTDYVGKIFYCIVTDASDLYSNAEDKGYFTIKMRTNAWHSWSTIYNAIYDCSDNSLSAIPTITTSIAPENKSNIKQWYYPEIEIELQDTETGFSLINVTDSNSTITFSGLSVGETIYINNEMKRIISDTELNRYSEHNGTWHRWKYGVNNITVVGKIILTTRAQFSLII
jgi:hypothetical protein